MYQGHVFIIKTVNACNLACAYCYSTGCDSGDLQVIGKPIVEKLVAEVAELFPGGASFIWHGGEPLLAGPRFFKRAVGMQEHYSRSGQSFENSIQSNGTLLNEEWLDVLYSLNVKVGISIDGSKSVHNANRRFHDGRPSFARTVAGIQLLRETGVDFGVSAVVTRDSLNHVEAVYQSLVETGAGEVALLPCVAYEAAPFGAQKAITASEFGHFMTEVFDLWFSQDDPRIQIRFFRNILMGLLGGTANLCTFNGSCQGFLAIDWNGDLYPCDRFFGIEEFRLGNVLCCDLQEVLSSLRYLQFLQASSKPSDKCLDCRWFEICRGGCSHHRYARDVRFTAPSFFCEARKHIISHIADQVVPGVWCAGTDLPHDEAEAAAEHSSVPSLYLNLGASCNNSCTFCVSAGSTPFSTTTVQARIALQAGANAGLERLVFSGGEITIRRDILDLVETASHLGYVDIQIQTNGRLLSELELLQQLLEAGASEFGISLHGPDPAIHEALTRVPGSFSQTICALQNLKRLRGDDTRVAVNCVISPSNYRYLSKVAKLLASLGVDTVQFAYVHAIGNASGVLEKGNWPSKTEVQPFVEEALGELAIWTHRRMSVMVEAYPFCFLRGHETCCTDLYMPATYEYVDGMIRPFDIRGARAKGPVCELCHFNAVCYGPWKEYPRNRGWDEFRPIQEYYPEDVIPQSMLREAGKVTAL